MMSSVVAELKTNSQYADRPTLKPVAVYLTAIDPSIPVEPSVVRTLIESRNESILVDVLTNNDAFWFLQQVIEQNFDRRFRIAESWEAIGTPF